jgi:hypothetical protein
VRSTAKGDTLYLHLFESDPGPLEVPLTPAVASLRQVGGEQVEFAQCEGRLRIAQYPRPRSALASVSGVEVLAARLDSLP